MRFGIQKLEGYTEWFKSHSPKFQAQIEKRLAKIEQEGHFGHIRDLDDGLFEIKFNNGARIYYARTGIAEITLLLGGNKNGQSKDIKRAKNHIAG